MRRPRGLTPALLAVAVSCLSASAAYATTLSYDVVGYPSSGPDTLLGNIYFDDTNLAPGNVTFTKLTGLGFAFVDSPNYQAAWNQADTFDSTTSYVTFDGALAPIALSLVIADTSGRNPTFRTLSINADNTWTMDGSVGHSASSGTYDLRPFSVPEPNTLLLMGEGLLGMAAARRRTH